MVPPLPDAYFDEVVESDPDFDEVELDFTPPPQQGEDPLVRVCATDDSMGLWPRFADCMTSGESTEE